MTTNKQLYLNIEGYDEVIENCKKIATKKNQDYSRHLDDISIVGVLGVTVRLLQKAVRAYNLALPGEKPAVEDEPLAETFDDFINYAVYARMLINGTWIRDDQWLKDRQKERKPDYTEKQYKKL